MRILVSGPTVYSRCVSTFLLTITKATNATASAPISLKKSQLFPAWNPQRSRSLIRSSGVVFRAVLHSKITRFLPPSNRARPPTRRSVRNIFEPWASPSSPDVIARWKNSLDKPRVLIVSEAFGRKFYPGQNPIGQRIKYGSADSKNPWMEIVGVVGNVKFKSFRQDPDAQPVFYGPLLQSEVIINMSVIVRTRSDPHLVRPAFRSGAHGPIRTRRHLASTRHSRAAGVLSAGP